MAKWNCWLRISGLQPDGTKVVRFSPVPAHRTPDAMETLHRRFAELWQAGEIEPLLLIPTYVLDFLCIHPFLDGNGRMARLLTLLLLYRVPGRTKATDWNGLKSHEKGAPNGDYNRFFDPEMSLLRSRRRSRIARMKAT